MIPVVIDASAIANRKLQDAGPEAAWLWFLGLCWCRQNPSTQGRIPKRNLTLVTGGVVEWRPTRVRKLVARVVAAKLWHEEPDAYRVHQYEQGATLIESLIAAIVQARSAVQTPSPIGGAQQSKPPVQSGEVQSKSWTTSEASSSSSQPIGSARDQDPLTKREEADDAVQNARANAKPNENRSVHGVGFDEKPAMDCTLDCPEDCDRSCVPEIMRGVSYRASLRLRTAMAGVWDGVNGMSTSGINRQRIATAEPALRKLAAEQAVDPLELFKIGTERFKTHCREQSKRLGLPVFLSQITVWCAPESDVLSAARSGGAAYQPAPRLEERPGDGALPPPRNRSASRGNS